MHQNAAEHLVVQGASVVPMNLIDVGTGGLVFACAYLIVYRC